MSRTNTSTIVRNSCILTFMICFICLFAGVGMMYHMRKHDLLNETPRPAGHYTPPRIVIAGN